MKQKINILFILLLLSSCQTAANESSSFSIATSNSQIEATSTLSDTTSITNTSSEEPTYLSSSDEELNSTISEESSSEDTLSSSSAESSYYNEPRALNLYAINDFHGSVIPNGEEVGIVKLGSYFKEQKKDGNTLLLNSGDMWQGAIESNYNYGNLLTDCMNEIEFDCFTLGNHEFDWGAERILENRERTSGKGYQTPFLAANIYNYDIDTKSTGDYADLGDKYVIRTLENGLKVGIIGVIGNEQITSICSQFADPYIFKSPTPIIKQLSDELRIQHNVDVVILDAHTDQKSILEDSTSTDTLTDYAGITKISPQSQARYVDAVFCAHTHQTEIGMVNGVPFVQGGSNGKAYSYVSIEVSPQGEVTCLDYNFYDTSSIQVAEDSNLSALVSSYKVISDQIGKETLGTLRSYLSYSQSLPNFVATAIAEQTIKAGYDISYAITNTGRSNLQSGTITYANLYKSLPFDNEIYILDAKGEDLIKEFNYSSTHMYRLDSQAIESSKTYRVAVIDYLALHRDVNRNYNYFPSAKIVGKLTKNGEVYNYRDITADYIRSFDETINGSSYLNSNVRYDTSKVSQMVNF